MRRTGSSVQSRARWSRIDRIDLLLPGYLFYALMHVHHSGHWKQIATRTLSLVNIRVSDVRSIELSPR